MRGLPLKMFLLTQCDKGLLRCHANETNKLRKIFIICRYMEIAMKMMQLTWVTWHENATSHAKIAIKAFPFNGLKLNLHQCFSNNWPTGHQRITNWSHFPTPLMLFQPFQQLSKTFQRSVFFFFFCNIPCFPRVFFNTISAWLANSFSNAFYLW